LLARLDKAEQVEIASENALQLPGGPLPTGIPHLLGRRQLPVAPCNDKRAFARSGQGLRDLCVERL